MKEMFNGALFDGEKIIENVCVTIDDDNNVVIGKENNTDLNYFMMPCLIDAHTHMTDINQVNRMMSYGVSSTFDVCASPSLISQSEDFKIISSIDMAMGFVLNPEKYVIKSINKGAKYIKVLLFNNLSIGLNALKEIVKTAHKHNLKVVVHATKISLYKQALEANVDIILHLPMKDELTDEFAKLIAKKGIYVVPTLTMMEIFAKTRRGGYCEEHFQNALKQVKTLYDNGVKILVGTDANIGNYAPEESYGDSMYTEINLLLKAGIPLIDILKGATSRIGEAFNMNLGKINSGDRANLLVFRFSNNNIEINYDNLEKVWINGKDIK